MSTQWEYESSERDYQGGTIYDANGDVLAIVTSSNPEHGPLLASAPEMAARIKQNTEVMEWSTAEITKLREAMVDLLGFVRWVDVGTDHHKAILRAEELMRTTGKAEK